MRKLNVSRFLPVIIATTLCVSWQGIAVCAPNPSETLYETKIEGAVHQILRSFFGRFEHSETNTIPAEAVKGVLFSGFSGPLQELL